MKSEGLNLRLLRPNLILCSAGAYGDTLLLTAVAHALSQRGIRRVSIATSHPKLFEHNPEIWSCAGCSESELYIVQKEIRNLRWVHYSVATQIPGIMQSPAEHIISVMCRKAGVTGEIELRPRIYLRKKERTPFQSEKETIVVQSSIANAGYPILNKEWYPERMQTVVDKLGQRFRIVQVGVKADVPLNGVLDLRGKLHVREVAGLLSHAKAYIGMVGFLMHLARAVDCPAVIIYGGREAPWQSGYSGNENIYQQVECAPCWREDTCPYGKPCMTAITPASVLAAFDKLLARPHPLPIDTAFIA